MGLLSATGAGFSRGAPYKNRGYPLRLSEAQVISAVIAERQEQLTKFGKQDHHAIAWLAILMEEVGEISRAVVEHLHSEAGEVSPGEWRREAQRNYIAVAAVATWAAQAMTEDETWRPIDVASWERPQPQK